MKWIRSVMALAIAGACAFAASRLAEPAKSNLPTRRALLAEDAIDPDRVDRIELMRDGRRYVFERDSSANRTADRVTESAASLTRTSTTTSTTTSTDEPKSEVSAETRQEAGRTSSWRQTEPVTHAADSWAVRQFISRILKAESVRHVDVAGDANVDRSANSAANPLVQAGLSPAIATVTLREAPAANGSRREVVVELGRRSLAGRAFARRAGDTGYDVVDSALHELALERDIRDFRRRELFPDLDEVERIVFTSGTNRTELVREKNGFQLVAPVKTRADRQQAEELIDALRRARSAGFIVDDPREPSVYGIDPPIARVEVETKRGAHALRIGDAVSIGAQDRFGLVEGTVSVVRVPAAEIAGIVPRAERLIDALATAVRPRDVARIDVVLGDSARGERLTLEREIDGWSATRTLASQAGANEAVDEAGGTRSDAILGRVSTAAVDRLFAALCETRAGSIELAPFPEDARVGQVVFSGFAGEPLDTIRVARRTDGKILLENGDGVLRVFGSIDLPITASELEFTKKSSR